MFLYLKEPGGAINAEFVCGLEEANATFPGVMHMRSHRPENNKKSDL